MTHNRLKHINIEVQKVWYSEKMCLENPTKLYIFGDNTLRKGYAGQAQIRHCQNSYGIVTKTNPGLNINDFFTDNKLIDKIAIDDDIEMLVQYLNSPGSIQTVVFPGDGLGTGLSDMQNKCPELLKHLNKRLFDIFGIDYGIN